MSNVFLVKVAVSAYFAHTAEYIKSYSQGEEQKLKDV